MSKDQQPNGPAKTIRAGNVKATIWENHTDAGDTYYSVSTTRSYKDGDQWKETNSFYRDDLPKLELVTRKAYEFIWLSPARHSEEKDEGFAAKVKNERASKPATPDKA